MNLLKFPECLLIEILQYIPGTTILDLLRVSGSWNRFFTSKDDKFWTELSKYSFKSLPLPSLSKFREAVFYSTKGFFAFKDLTFDEVKLINTIERREKEKPSVSMKISICGSKNAGKTTLHRTIEQGPFFKKENKESFQVRGYIDHTLKTENPDLIPITVGISILETNTSELIASVFFESDAFFLVFSLNNQSSFDSIKNKIEEIEKKRKGSIGKNIPAVLIGSKCDLLSERIITLEEGIAFAQDHAIPYFEISTKSIIQVTKAFDQIVIQFLRNSHSPIYPKSFKDKFLGKFF